MANQYVFILISLLTNVVKRTDQEESVLIASTDFMRIITRYTSFASITFSGVRNFVSSLIFRNPYMFK